MTLQRQILSFDIAPGDERTIHTKPPEPTRLAAIEHEGEIEDLIVTSLRVGLHEQLTGAGDGPFAPFVVIVDAINKGAACLEALSPERPLNLTLKNVGDINRVAVLTLHFRPVSR